MNNQKPKPVNDPLSFFPRAFSKLNTLWMRWTYPFLSLGNEFWAHYSVDLRRPIATRIRIGNSVKIDRQVWLNIPPESTHLGAVIVLEDDCKIGRRTMISAKNSIHIERNTIFSPSVLVMDHNHAFEDVTVPISHQGVTTGGAIRIEEGCWIGYGAAIICGHGELVIGKHSVVGANSVVNRSIPPYSVVSGNPARIVKQFDVAKGQWVIGSSGATIRSQG